MSLGFQREARFWLIGFAVFFAALYLLSGILLPFVAGMAVAYFLDPACDWPMVPAMFWQTCFHSAVGIPPAFTSH